MWTDCLDLLSCSGGGGACLGSGSAGLRLLLSGAGHRASLSGLPDCVTAVAAAGALSPSGGRESLVTASEALALALQQLPSVSASPSHLKALVGRVAPLSAVPGPSPGHLLQLHSGLLLPPVGQLFEQVKRGPRAVLLSGLPRLPHLALPHLALALALIKLQPQVKVQLQLHWGLTQVIRLLSLA